MIKNILSGIFILTIAVFVISIYVLIFQVIGVDAANKATILSGILSMIGGFAGAMGAYMVARYQINQENSKDKINSLAAELSIYITLSLEFEKIIRELDEVEKFKQINEFKINGDPNTQEQFYQELIIIFDAIIWDRWIDYRKISDSILLKELLMFEESFKRIVEVLAYDIINQDEKQLKLYEQNQLVEIAKLHHEIIMMQKEKKIYLKEIYYCSQKSIKIYKMILNKISSIENLIEGKSNINDFRFFSTKEDFKIERND